MEDALGFAGGAAGVEDEKRVLAIKTFSGAFGVYFFHFIVPKEIAPVLHVHRAVGAAQHDDFFHGSGSGGERSVHVILQRHHLAATISAVRGDNDRGFTVFGAVFDAFAAEAPEDHAMDRPDAGAGQHGDGGFRNHGQVDHDAVFGLRAVGFQHVGKAADFALQLLIGEGAPVAGFAFEDNGGFIFTGWIGSVAVHAILSDIQLPPAEPPGGWRLPLEHGFPGLLPQQLRRLACPEFCGVFDAFRILLFVSFQTLDPCSLRKLRGWWENTVFDQVGLGGLAHSGLGKRGDYQPDPRHDNYYPAQIRHDGNLIFQANGDACLTFRIQQKVF